METKRFIRKDSREKQVETIVRHSASLSTRRTTKGVSYVSKTGKISRPLAFNNLESVIQNIAAALSLKKPNKLRLLRDRKIFSEIE